VVPQHGQALTLLLLRKSLSPIKSAVPLQHTTSMCCHLPWLMTDGGVSGEHSLLMGS